MELSDLLLDIETPKLAIIGTTGFITGVLSNYLNFYNVLKKNKFFTKDKQLDSELIKTGISFIGAFGSTELKDGNIYSNIGELTAYTLSFRTGFELGDRIYKTFK